MVRQGRTNLQKQCKRRADNSIRELKRGLVEGITVSSQLETRAVAQRTAVAW